MTAESTSPAAKATAENLDALSYEEAREQLMAVVGRLEAGGASLEESLALWERGEALGEAMRGVAGGRPQEAGGGPEQGRGQPDRRLGADGQGPFRRHVEVGSGPRQVQLFEGLQEKFLDSDPRKPLLVRRNHIPRRHFG